MMIAKRVLNWLGRPFGVNPFPRAFENPLWVQADTMADVFDAIHRTNYWGSDESMSGVGSERAFTRRYQSGLADTLSQHGIASVFDAPCGDLNWMAGFLEGHPLEYIGGDISGEIIARVRDRYPHRDLRVFDITTDPFPKVDLWHCRDCLFHLPLGEIWHALENFAASQIQYCLITSHRARWLHRNLDLGPGGFRFVDLERAPFDLPPPLARIPDYRKGSDFPRYVCLWSREQIAQSCAVAAR